MYFLVKIKKVSSKNKVVNNVNYKNISILTNNFYELFNEINYKLKGFEKLFWNLKLYKLQIFLYICYSGLFIYLEKKKNKKKPYYLLLYNHLKII